MALLPYTSFNSVGAITPLLIDSPHSGRIYPVDFHYTCPFSLLRQAEDAYVDEIIIGAAKTGATIVLAEFPRSMIDVNRAENDLDPAYINGIWPESLAPDEMTLAGFGLVRRICRNGIPLYNNLLTVAEVRRRIDTYYKPYHNYLENLVAGRLRKFSACYFIDVHSMPDRYENGIPRSDFILGNRDGQSCSTAFINLVQRIIKDLGYSVALNEPYKGREIVKRYGLAGQGAEALQMEINRKLYLNENKTEKNSNFNVLRRNMDEFFTTLMALINAEANKLLAAE